MSHGDLQRSTGFQVDSFRLVSGLGSEGWGFGCKV